MLTGTIIGFGSYHYEYDSGRSGDVAAAGFAPRKAAMSIYLIDGVGRYPSSSRGSVRTRRASDASTSATSPPST